MNTAAQQTARAVGDKDRDAQTLVRDGVIVIENALTPNEIRQVRDTLADRLSRPYLGRNPFEGYRTERVYTLVALGEIFERVTVDPAVLALCDRLLQPGYLLTASQAIEIRPDETPQAYHTDDSFYPIPRPRDAISIATIWAIDDFTVENGATQYLPGSHRWGDDRVGDWLARIDFSTDGSAADGDPQAQQPPAGAANADPVSVTMPSGSVALLLGTLVHRGGRNGSPASRLALSNQYCQPWARQQENYTLAISPQRVADMPERVRRLLGYEIHPPFMGHVGGMHPDRLLPGGGRKNH